jgi:hypothetical protein
MRMAVRALAPPRKHGHHPALRMGTTLNACIGAKKKAEDFL